MTALIYCPFPDADAEVAGSVGQALLDEKLIGCINIGGAIRSIFCWNGKAGSGDEVAALLKTNASLLEQAIARLEDLHPYEAPAILGWPCVGGAATTQWLSKLGEGARNG